jgi:hypothetical protein
MVMNPNILKKMTMKNIFCTGLVLLFLLPVACNREPAITPSVEFTTSLNNNTTPVRQSFTLYLNDVKGEWVVYFKGDKPTTTYAPDFYRAEGVNIDLALDSVIVSGYGVAGEYPFTVVASSSGNWAEEYLQDAKTIMITVTEE